MLAVNTLIEVAPDKAFYHVGEPVTLTVMAGGGARVEARITYLADTIATISADVSDGAARLQWTPPAESPRGYGVEAQLLDANGRVLGSASTAVDVLESWLQAPRYGFLSNFAPGRVDAEATMAWNARYHINGLQFYDWQYRHEALLPPEETFVDLLGRRLSLDTIRSLIDEAHARNIAAMPYTAIYGASAAFYRQHPTWALFASKDQPFEFGDDFLVIMDPSPGSPWADHLLAQYRHVLEETAFDGIHIDTYGAPMRGYNQAGELVALDDVFPRFINETATLVEALRGEPGAVIFNAVRNWSIATVAPANQDAVYIEVWDPYRRFMDLPRVVSEAQRLGGNKPVIIAAYINPEHEHNVRLVNALIFASGGYHLELGEPGAMLSDPYFPQYATMEVGMQEIERAYYDFLVRYENVLAVGTRDATSERAEALNLEGIETGTRRSRDRVAVIVRQGPDTETFSLVNLMGIDGEFWDTPLGQAPVPLDNLVANLRVERPVSRIWLASPDRASLEAVPLPFRLTPNDNGHTASFAVPSLAYWTLIVVEYSK